MEPLSLIIKALVTGAAKAAGDAAPDAYNGLKALIKRKFAKEPKAEMILSEHQIDPETYEAPLKKKLAEFEVDQDEAIISAAKELLKQLESQELTAGKSQEVKQTGDVRQTAGDNAKQIGQIGSANTINL